MYELDSSPYASLPEEEIKHVIDAYKLASYEARVVDDELKKKFNELSEVCVDMPVPSVSKVREYMDAVVVKGTLLNQCVTAFDESFYNNELTQLEELLDSAIEYIEALNNQSWDVTQYVSGSFTNLPEYTAWSEELVDTINYHQYNQEELVKAQELCAIKADEIIADGREEEGKNKLNFGLETSLASLIALLAFGNLPSGVLILFGSFLTLGGFCAVEGWQDICYGKNGDITTESVNLLKSLMEEEYYNAALSLGHVTTNTLMIYKDLDDLRKILSSNLAKKKATMEVFDGVTPNSVLDDLSMASSADELIPVGNADNLVDSDSKAVDDLLNGLEETTNGKGVARNFESSGGYEQTLDDFESLNPINVQDIQTKYGAGKVGTLGDGTKVVARQGSTTGGATLEIRVSNSKIYKIRY